MIMTVTPTATPMMAPMAVFDRPPPPPSSADEVSLPEGVSEATGIDAVVKFPADLTVPFIARVVVVVVLICPPAYNHVIVIRHL